MILSTLAFAFATMSTHNPASLVKPTMVQAFPLSEVQLTGGPFFNAQTKTEGYLLSLEPERLLHGFRENAGLKPKAPLYGGWENAGLAGHTLGHYLSACSQAYAGAKGNTTGDLTGKFKEKIDAIVNGLAECQANRPDGLIEAIPKGDASWAQIKKGDIKSGGFDLNGMWSPWYTHHKVFIGLMDAYTLTGNTKALEIAKKFGDWAIDETKGLSDEQWAKMLRCEYGGMNEAMTELYQLTHEEKYLTLAKKFYDHPNLDPIENGQDKLAGTHSNTQIPKILGLAALNDTTGGGDYKKAVKFFWDTVVDHHTFVIGGNGDHEYFTAPDRLNEELTTNTCETCCTYNMLKLTRHLFEWDPQPAYMDYYERAHLNHILAAQDPGTGMISYFFPLLSGAARGYSNPEDDFTCCHGSGMESHTKHQDTVFFHQGNDTLYVTQFEPTVLDWKETGLSLEMQTGYPVDGKVRLKVLSGSNDEVTMKLRHPAWASSFPILVNGEKALDSTDPSKFASITRKWKEGDTVEFEMPMTFHSEPILGDNNKLALLYGPSVLAADMGPEDGKDFLAPVLVPEGKKAEECVNKTGTATFAVATDARPSALDLRPIYNIVSNRYAVYFDVFTQGKWNTVEKDFRENEARIQDLVARTVDILRVGEMQPERDHNLTSEKCDMRDVNGKGFRTPFAQGYFEFDLKVDGQKDNDLVLTVWVNSRSKRGGEISVDGKLIEAITGVDGLPNNTFQDLTFHLPPSVTSGKDKIKVRISGSADKSGPSVSSVRSVRSKS